MIEEILLAAFAIYFVVRNLWTERKAQQITVAREKELLGMVKRYQNLLAAKDLAVFNELEHQERDPLGEKALEAQKNAQTTPDETQESEVHYNTSMGNY